MGGPANKPLVPETPEQREARLNVIFAEVEAKRAAGIEIHGCEPEDFSEPTLTEAELRSIIRREAKQAQS